MSNQMREVRIKGIDKPLRFPASYSDEQIADILKSHPAMSQPSISEDIYHSLANAPGQIYESLLSLPKELAKTGVESIKHPISAAKNIGIGLAEGALGTLNAPRNIAEYLASKGTISPETAGMIPQVPIQGIEQSLGIEQPEEGMGLLRAIAGFTPVSRVGAAAKGLKGIGQRAAAAAVYAAGQNQDPLQMALMEPILSGTGKAIESIPKAAPSAMLRGAAPMQEILERANAAAGTKAPLGDVLKNPGLKRFYENVMQTVPLGGVRNTLMDFGEQIDKQARSIYERLTGEPVKNAGESIKSALKKAYDEAHEVKRNLYKKRDEIAEQSGVTSQREQFKKAVYALDEEINADPLTQAFVDPKTKQIITEAKKALQPDIKQRELFNALPPELQKQLELDMPVEPASLKNMQFLKSEIASLAREADIKGDRATARRLFILEDALAGDIENSIAGADNPALKAAHQAANKHYRENVLPFDDRDVAKYVKGQGDTDLLINSFLKTSRVADRSNLLNKLVAKVPEHKGTLLREFFQNQMKGDFDPRQFARAYEKLQPKQRQILFSKDQQAAMDNLSTLVNMGGEALSVMFNPKTGQRSQDLKSLTAPILSGAVLSPGGLGSLLFGAAVPSLGTAALNKAMTSPAIRKRLIEKMLKTETKGASKAAKLATKTGKAIAKSRSVTAPLELYLNTAAGYDETM